MFEFPIFPMDMGAVKDEMDYENYKKKYITIIASVAEYVTGVKYNSTAKVKVATHRYKLRFIDHPKTLKPSLDFNVTLKLSTYNDELLTLEDQTKTVMVSVTQHKNLQWDFWVIPRMLNESISPTQPYYQKDIELPVPADGLISFTVQTKDDIQILYIEASFEDSKETLRLYRNYKSPSYSYLQIHKIPGPLQVGSQFSLDIQTNFPMVLFYFIVISRGEIVASGQSESPWIILEPHADWAPWACIIVYCVLPDGEIVNDVIQLPMTQILQNSVSLSWSEAMKKPAEEVSLKISVEESDSVVWLLVVDKATRSTDSDNDLTKETVQKKISKYSDSEEEAHSHTMGDPYSVFKTCDLVVLTDANLHKSYYEPEILLEIQDSEAVLQTDTANQEPRERWIFPETWLWNTIDMGASTTAEMTVTVPDSITTWCATAFVMSKTRGLGLVPMPAKLTVFQEFFLSLNLPPFITLGEELLMDIYLYNYLSEALQVIVIVAESDTFEFISSGIEDSFTASTRKVSVGSQSGVSIVIPIRPLVLGEIPISVKGTSSVASDAVRRTILVKPGGLEQLYSNTMLVETSLSDPTFYRHITFTFPADVVEGSRRVEVTAVGDILGPSIKGLESLIKMPYGCGEQNMINFAPNIYILWYLNATGQADQETTERAMSFMRKGYQQELSYQRQDGSFSAFGETDSSGSTWLTAFVLRCFLQARSFIAIDTQVLDRAATWLIWQQKGDGSFGEPGRVIHTELQGGQPDSSVTLTAYVLIALLEDEGFRTRYSSEVTAALVFLETRLALGVSRNYTLSLLTYALALADRYSVDTAMMELIGRAEMRDGVPMWTSSDSGLAKSWQPHTAVIEMVSYLLLSMNQLGRAVDGLNMVKWLSRQRDDLGGYGSTQNTIVALQALSSFPFVSGSHESHTLDLHIMVNQTSATAVSFHIHSDNYLLYQSQEIEATDDELYLQVTAEGNGLALLQLNVFYNIKSGELNRRRRYADDDEALDLYVELHDDIMMPLPHLQICTRLSASAGLTQTGMVAMEVDLLSGFCLAQDGVQTNNVTKKVETEPGKVILYLDSVTTEELCVEIPLIVESKVGKVKDATVCIYDYYEPRRKTVRTYRSEKRQEMSVCSFCGGDCSQCSPEDRPDDGITSQARQRPLLTALPFTLLLVLLLI
ncbi:hypothetical protein LDENG_00082300 [Lucifuga dentata]|nr:hypothetical protein LDENG_00082300 [Lucifuga dentata]